jgi:hypothetical protein
MQSILTRTVSPVRFGIMHKYVFMSHKLRETTWPRSITVYEISFDGTTLLRLRMVGDP